MTASRVAIILAVLLGLTAASLLKAEQAPTDDPFIWLEDKDGPRAMQWVQAEDAITVPRLQGDPRYAAYYQQAYAIVSADDRIPYPAPLHGRIFNFWRDTAHPHGIWRWTTVADYSNPQPRWTTLLDLDALGKAEGKTWVFKGAYCFQPDERLCLVALSDGGEDAVSYREFDLDTGQFVPGGFSLPKSKQSATWLDKDTLLVARDWGTGTMTSSGYPFVVKLWHRGQPVDQAREVFRGDVSDQLETGADVLTDAQGHKIALIVRGTTFFGNQVFVLSDHGAVRLPFPQKTSVIGMVDGRVVIQTSEDWPTAGHVIPAGALVSLDYRQLTGGAVTPTVIFQPGPTQSISGVAITRTRVVATILDNVVGRALIATPVAGGWATRTMALPDKASIDIAATTIHDDTAYLTVAGFLTPTTLWSIDAGSAAPPLQLKALPAKFDASRDVVDQFAATSTDGTRIPYFIVHRKDIPLDGSTPTIMTAYGGFEISSTPYYSGIQGKLWLEGGGSLVLANIRGGGEFGPAWHEAGRKTKRQVIYDDFAAVAKDIFARKLSSPAKFGIYGGSNGGLLMGVELVQHPDLWRAVVIQVPLLDMMRYERIEAGASWVDEYGSVSVPAEKAFLRTISPYQNLRKGAAYPEPYIWTTTKDDRVGPQHARKFAARMKQYGLPYLFYEDTAGGHSGDADIAQSARLSAMEMVYFHQKLGN